MNDKNTIASLLGTGMRGKGTVLERLGPCRSVHSAVAQRTVETAGEGERLEPLGSPRLGYAGLDRGTGVWAAWNKGAGLDQGVWPARNKRDRTGSNGIERRGTRGAWTDKPRTRSGTSCPRCAPPLPPAAPTPRPYRCAPTAAPLARRPYRCATRAMAAMRAATSSRATSFSAPSGMMRSA